MANPFLKRISFCCPGPLTEKQWSQAREVYFTEVQAARCDECGLLVPPDETGMRTHAATHWSKMKKAAKRG